MAAILPFLPIVDKVLDLIGDKFPSEKERQEAKLALMQAEQAGELDFLKTQLSAILAEANSEDPWTSRARPSFLYVIYTMLLFGIPMGFVAALDPFLAEAVAGGFKAWLSAIPEPLYTLFGVGYIGYAGARTFDKYQITKKQ
jgi:hypothetical protein